MTIGEFAKIIKAYNIPDDVTMLSDSGWECFTIMNVPKNSYLLRRVMNMRDILTIRNGV